MSQPPASRPSVLEPARTDSASAAVATPVRVLASR